MTSTDHEDVDTSGEEADVDQTGLTGESEEPDQRRRPWSPRQARRIRIAVAGTIMAAIAVTLVLGLREQPSLLTVGVYGAALVLCGVVVELSRRGRTRIGTWLLGTGLVACAVADQLLRAL
ncbi:hypothetical protein [Streptomyces sp. NPDC003480]